MAWSPSSRPARCTIPADAGLAHPRRAGIFRALARLAAALDAMDRLVRRDRCCSAPADCRASEFFAELAPRLRRVIDSDATLLAHAGPAHAADDERRAGRADRPRASSPRGGRRGRGRAVVRSEYLVEDFNTFADLARRRVAGRHPRPRPAGGPERSARYRDLFAPGRHPARAARGVRDPRPRLGRRAHRPPQCERAFTKRRRRGARARHGRDRRRHPRVAALRRRAPWRRTPSAPGLVVLGRGDEVELITPPARELLAAMRSPASATRGHAARDRARRSRRSCAARATPAGGNVVTVPGGRRLDHAARLAARRRRVRPRGDRDRARRRPRSPRRCGWRSTA